MTFSLERAEILSEAMAYLQRYAGTTVVVKFGGHAMINAEAKQGFAKDIVLLQQSGIRIVIVHGGGPQIGETLKKLAIPTQFHQGLRITDADTMDVAEMVLSGLINKNIVSLIQQAGGQSVGISGKDGRTILARRMTHNSAGEAVDLGQVGIPAQIDTALITQLLDGGFIPVIAPIGSNAEGVTLNINSDTSAGAIAAALHAKRLLLLSDIPGVLDLEGNLIPKMDQARAEAALSDGTAQGGMIPKLETCLNAVRAGLEAAVVLDGRNPHATLIELLSDQGSGTLIA